MRNRYLAYLACSFSIGVFSAFNNFTLSLWLATFTSSYLLIGLLGNTRSFEGTVISPIFGVWSDRTWIGLLGRRRPFILVGGLTSALLLALTPAIGRLPTPTWLGWLLPDVVRLAPAILAIFLFTLTYNVMDDIHKALLIDITTPAERNMLSAWATVVQMIGWVAILVLGFLLWNERVPDSAFAVTGALFAVGVLITVLGVREPEPAVWRAERHHHPADEARPTLGTFATRYRGAAIFCLVWFAYWSGVNAVMPLVSVYTRDILGASVGEAQLLPALLLASTTILALPMGWCGERFGKRRMIGSGFVIMALAALGGLVITTKAQGAGVFLLAGVGNAAIVVLSVPLLGDLVPRGQIGAATGILAGSGSLAAPLASLVAGALSDIFGPRAIFGMMAALVLVALLLLPAVQKPARAKEDEPAPELAPASKAVPGISR